MHVFAHSCYEYTSIIQRSYNLTPEYFMTRSTFLQNGSLIVIASIYNLDLILPHFNTVQVLVDNNFNLDQF